MTTTMVTTRNYENINEDVAPEVTDDDQSQAMNEDNIENTNEDTETTGVDDETPMGIRGVDKPNQDEKLNSRIPQETSITQTTNHQNQKPLRRCTEEWTPNMENEPIYTTSGRY